jgi:hypothetical protein
MIETNVGHNNQVTTAGIDHCGEGVATRKATAEIDLAAAT